MCWGNKEIRGLIDWMIILNEASGEIKAVECTKRGIGYETKILAG